MKTPIYIINLETSTERRTFMKEQLQKLGLLERVTFLPAADYRQGIPKGAAPFYKPGSWKARWSLLDAEVGCFESHLSAWRAIEQGSGANTAVVMEDDILISGEIAGVLQELDTCDTDQVDLVHLDFSPDSTSARNRVRYGAIERFENLILRNVLTNVASTACYAITPKAAGKLIALAEKGYCDTADDFMFQPRPGLKVHQAFPAVAIQEQFCRQTKTFASTVAPQGASGPKRAKGPGLYRIGKEFARSFRRLADRVWRNANTLRAGGCIGAPRLSGDLADPR